MAQEVTGPVPSIIAGYFSSEKYSTVFTDWMLLCFIVDCPVIFGGDPPFCRNKYQGRPSNFIRVPICGPKKLPPLQDVEFLLTMKDKQKRKKERKKERIENVSNDVLNYLL